MDDDLALADLSGRTGQTEAELRRWIELGLLKPEADGYSPLDIERVRLVELLLRRGIDLEAVASTERRAPFLDGRLDTLYPRGVRPRMTLEQAAEEAGIDIATAGRIWQAINIGDENEELDRADAGLMRGLKFMIDGGFPEDGLLQLMRVYADAISRVAEAGQRAFHIYVHERLRKEGLSPNDALRETEQVAQFTRPAEEPTVLYFLRKAAARSRRDDMVLHVAEDAGLLPAAGVPGQVMRAVLFVDLSSYTPLSEAMGDEKTAEIVDTFSVIVRTASRRHEGRIVKQIGDAFMLVFLDPASAVAAALEIEQHTSEEAQFPASRSGIHWGQVLYREGDYLGSSVNLAARVGTEADRHQVVVTGAVRKEVKDMADVEFVRLGKRPLKGVPRETELFEVRPRREGPATKIIDPVCGMELGEEEVAARLTLEGVERSFCSDNCLRQFVAAPERYANA
jgi:class 3 adenylate cyclase/YHS domain-containing protein